MHHEILFTDEVCPKSTFGLILATPNALESIPNREMLRALSKHLQGDWGTLDPEDIEANENALLHGGRLFSAYKTSAGFKFWIITEADRSSTTILLPEDY